VYVVTDAGQWPSRHQVWKQDMYGHPQCCWGTTRRLLPGVLHAMVRHACKHTPSYFYAVLQSDQMSKNPVLVTWAILRPTWYVTMSHEVLAWKTVTRPATSPVARASGEVCEGPQPETVPPASVGSTHRLLFAQ
jgi:hypothetical protein